ncbi:MAG: glycyl-radical enzyme activating protein [Clostridiales bacterium]|jgi:pyruvate formate lyase activating enzyme|nr:glycyl-radical enzyme activating protein [Clostridiales bacterium]
MYGTIFNIQRYSLHDGPGIRTVIFLKGCPLRCVWCCNPESQSADIEVGFDASKCLYGSGCRACAERFGRETTDGATLIGREELNRMTEKTAYCPTKALFSFGKIMTVGEALDTVERDEVFFGKDGGITLSGGEPFFQSGFALALLKEAKARHIRTAVETCGAVRGDIILESAKYIDYLLYDIKHLDGEKHKAWTGAKNAEILKNFEDLCRVFPSLLKLVRTPVIKGFNDDIIDDIRAYAASHGAEFEPLPYHAFGTKKYEYLGKEYPYVF